MSDCPESAHIDIPGFVECEPQDPNKGRARKCVLAMTSKSVSYSVSSLVACSDPKHHHHILITSIVLDSVSPLSSAGQGRPGCLEVYSGSADKKTVVWSKTQCFLGSEKKGMMGHIFMKSLSNSPQEVFRAPRQWTCDDEIKKFELSFAAKPCEAMEKMARAFLDEKSKFRHQSSVPIKMEELYANNEFLLARNCALGCDEKIHFRHDIEEVALKITIRYVLTCSPVE